MPPHQNPTHSHRDEKNGRQGLVLAIGVFKLVKAAMLITVGILSALAVHRSPDGVLGPWIDALRIDPNNRYFQAAFARVSGLDAHRLEEISLGTFFYAALFLVEGVGLVMRRRWAEWFTVIVTGSFVPLEVWELARRFTVARVAVIVVNLGILAYLLVRRLHDHQQRHGRRAHAR